jgi:hypothetical protein
VQTDAIARAVERQLDEIKNALNAGRISPEEEAKFRFRAKLDKLKAEKEAYLANIPCQLTPQGYLFELQEHTQFPEPAARERLVGINNRIVSEPVARAPVDSPHTDHACSQRLSEPRSRLLAFNLRVANHWTDALTPSFNARFQCAQLN